MAVFHTIIDFPKPVPVTSTDASPGGDIVLENVNFAYPGRPEVKVLDNLSLRFPAGKVTAIVGPSGAGKSTIVGIIERWYEFNGDPVTNPLVSLDGFASTSFALSSHFRPPSTRVYPGVLPALFLMSPRFYGVETGWSRSLVPS